MNKQEAMDVIESISYYEKVNGNPLEDLVNKIYDDLKPVVPKFVAEWIERRKKLFTLHYVLTTMEEEKKFENFYKWFSNDVEKNTELLARAWIFGYTIEKEKLYTVEIPNPNSPWKYTFLTNRGPGVSIDSTDGDFWKDDSKNQLTESEIKEDFEWAKEVE